MTYTTNRWYWTTPQTAPNHPYNYGWTIDIPWLAEHEWGVNISIQWQWMRVSEGFGEAWLGVFITPIFDLCVEYNIPVIYQINGIFDTSMTELTGAEIRARHASFYDDWVWVIQQVEGRYGPSGTDGAVLQGYWQENAYNSAMDWLLEQTALPIRQGVYRRGWIDAGSNAGIIGNGAESKEAAIARRITQIDGFDIELWSYSDIDPAGDNLQGFAAYLRATYPDSTIGINSYPFAGPATNSSASSSWNLDYTDLTETRAPIATQEARFARAVKVVKAATGTFDIIQVQVGTDNDTMVMKDNTTPTFWEWQKEQFHIWESQALTTPGTKYVWAMDHKGVIPYYSGASICTNETIKPPDTFANTGNELILLKDYSTASTHDITVTSTDTLTHEDYTLTCLPDRGTIIGPYPLDDYGALPTIEYDNTNLYVSVLKVEPTA